MTVPARKTARNALVALITTNMTTLNAVFDHLPKDFNNKSPVASVESFDWFPQWMPALENDIMLRVILSVRRDVDAAAAEDLLDDQSKEFIELIEDWDNAYFSQASTIEYESIGSTQYKSEAFLVAVDWQG
jgi:hypothetical protein